jgi:hypothetical protein
MNKDELFFWKNKYDKEEDLYYQNDEEELRKKFQENNFITKQDLIKIIKWKFQGKLSGRGTRILNLLKDVEESFIEEISKLAFKTKDDKIRLILFSSIKGIGNALSTVILTFYDPENYGVLDIHVWRGLFGKEPNDIFSNHDQAIKFIKKLREISSETGLSCRDVEKAIFKKDLDKSKTAQRIT